MPAETGHQKLIVALDVTSGAEAIAIAGELPSPLDPPSGCAFRTRCPFAVERCATERPQPRTFDGRLVACHRAEEIADVAIACGDTARRFGLSPKIALVSHADFGSFDTASARKMRQALNLLRERAPDLEVDGEMGADTALSQEIRDKVLPGSRLKGEANVLIMPNLDAANIAFQFSKMLADALPVGPLLLGPAQPAHILTPSVTARGIVNITAAAVVEAQGSEGVAVEADSTAEAGTPLMSA